MMVRVNRVAAYERLMYIFVIGGITGLNCQNNGNVHIEMATAQPIPIIRSTRFFVNSRTYANGFCMARYRSAAISNKLITVTVMMKLIALPHINGHTIPARIPRQYSQGTTATPANMSPILNDIMK